MRRRQLLLKCLDGVDEGPDDAPAERNTDKAPDEDEFYAVAHAARSTSAFHY